MSDKETGSTDGKPIKPLIKPRKKFVAKKKTFKTDKPMEYRVRHIRLASLEAAQLVRQTIVEYQKDLANKPMDDPDKMFHDQEKVERFFAKLAKKYSACVTRNLGGDLDWVHNHDIESEVSIVDEYIKAQTEGSVLTSELLNNIMKCERAQIPEPIKSALGFHVVLICEARYHTSGDVSETGERNLVDDIHGNADHSGPKNWSSDVAPN
tara:strand:+ start:7136 stop:7762 length:627 start_codon:yes stop_codon:yes gene_type:complete